MFAMGDSPKTAKRRAREKRTISQMVVLYCAGNHEAATRTETAHCGEAICPACLAIDANAVLRTERCRKMDEKTSCEQCGNHCYKPEDRERIRAVMRYAGPRMMGRHPVAALRHLMGI
ncbi:MAG: nitrous oxide-stimulated promoter family protein [Gordonibacter sp.]|uniref:nitrous oxide-stimulated promoter family protein n=2 Tax=Gordonibacter sp. TaxID=1968902 RepID=UPI002FC9BA10